MVLVAKSKRTTSIHHKRRHGQHHKQSDHYFKPYSPYLPLALIVVAGVVFSSLWGHANKSVLGYATNLSANALVADTNTQRAANQLGDLSLNAQLSSAAQSKATDMATRDYWAHNTPGGQTPWTFITSAGYNYKTAGENLAYGFDSSSDTLTAWMNSPDHRANILNNTYVDVGFGIANAPDYQGSGPETIIVAMYASPQAMAAAPQTTLSGPVKSTPVSQPALAPATPTAAPAPTDAAPAQASPPETNATTTEPTPATTKSASVIPVATRNVSRIQLFANGNASWSAFAVAVIAGVCFVVFVLRHGLFWRRALVRGEAFVIHHKLLDIALVLVIVVGVVLTRTAGVIH